MLRSKDRATGTSADVQVPQASGGGEASSDPRVAEPLKPPPPPLRPQAPEHALGRRSFDLLGLSVTPPEPWAGNAAESKGNWLPPVPSRAAESAPRQRLESGPRMTQPADAFEAEARSAARRSPFGRSSQAPQSLPQGVRPSAAPSSPGHTAAHVSSGAQPAKRAALPAPSQKSSAPVNPSPAPQATLPQGVQPTRLSRPLRESAPDPLPRPQRPVVSAPQPEAAPELSRRQRIGAGTPQPGAARGAGSLEHTLHGLSAPASEPLARRGRATPPVLQNTLSGQPAGNIQQEAAAQGPDAEPLARRGRATLPPPRPWDGSQTWLSHAAPAQAESRAHFEALGSQTMRGVGRLEAEAQAAVEGARGLDAASQDEAEPLARRGRASRPPQPVLPGQPGQPAQPIAAPAVPRSRPREAEQAPSLRARLEQARSRHQELELPRPSNQAQAPQTGAVRPAVTQAPIVPRAAQPTHAPSASPPPSHELTQRFDWAPPPDTLPPAGAAESTPSLQAQLDEQKRSVEPPAPPRERSHSRMQARPESPSPRAQTHQHEVTRRFESREQSPASQLPARPQSSPSLHAQTPQREQTRSFDPSAPTRDPSQPQARPASSHSSQMPVRPESSASSRSHGQQHEETRRFEPAAPAREQSPPSQSRPQSSPSLRAPLQPPHGHGETAAPSPREHSPSSQRPARPESSASSRARGQQHEQTRRFEPAAPARDRSPSTHVPRPQSSPSPHAHTQQSHQHEQARHIESTAPMRERSHSSEMKARPESSPSLQSQGQQLEQTRRFEPTAPPMRERSHSSQMQARPESSPSVRAHAPLEETRRFEDGMPAYDGASSQPQAAESSQRHPLEETRRVFVEDEDLLSASLRPAPSREGSRFQLELTPADGYRRDSTRATEPLPATMARRAAWPHWTKAALAGVVIGAAASVAMGYSAAWVQLFSRGEQSPVLLTAAPPDVSDAPRATAAAAPPTAPTLPPLDPAATPRPQAATAPAVGRPAAQSSAPAAQLEPSPSGAHGGSIETSINAASRAPATREIERSSATGSPQRSVSTPEHRDRAEGSGTVTTRGRSADARGASIALNGAAADSRAVSIASNNAALGTVDPRGEKIAATEEHGAASASEQSAQPSPSNTAPSREQSSEAHANSAGPTNAEAAALTHVGDSNAQGQAHSSTPDRAASTSLNTTPSAAAGTALGTTLSASPSVAASPEPSASSNAAWDRAASAAANAPSAVASTSLNTPPSASTSAAVNMPSPSPSAAASTAPSASSSAAWDRAASTSANAPSAVASAPMNTPSAASAPGAQGSASENAALDAAARAPANRASGSDALSTLDQVLAPESNAPAASAAPQPAAAAEPSGPRPVLSIKPLDPATSESLGGPPAQPTREQVRDVMSAMHSQLAQCVQDKHGTTYANVTVQGNGRVSYSLIDGAFAGTEAGSCLARALRSATFPEFVGPPFKVRYPLVF